jgi:hypothetical protein
MTGVLLRRGLDTHTHTHIYIYIYIYTKGGPSTQTRKMAIYKPERERETLEETNPTDTFI